MAELEIHHEGHESDPFGRTVGVLAAIIAVFLAAVTIQSHRSHTAAVIHRTDANDKWAFYQAKSIKRHIAELANRTAATPDNAAHAAEEAARYQKEEADVQAHARALEAERDAAAKHGKPLGFAIASLQIAIALASVCLITKRKPLWAASGLLGAVGIGYLIYGLYFVV